MKGHQFRVCFILAALVAICNLPHASAAIPVVFSTVVDSSVQIPNRTVNFAGFGAPVLDGSKVIFPGALGLNQGLYRTNAGMVEELIEPGPGLPVDPPANTVFGSTGYGTVSAENGEVVFKAGIVGANQVIARGPQAGFLASLTAYLVRSSDIMPGYASGYSFFEGVSVSNGDVAWFSQSQSSSSEQGIYLHDGAVVNTVALVGDAIPGTGDVFGSFPSKSMAGRDGTIAFVGANDNNQAFRMGVYADDGSGLAKIIDDTDLQPGGFVLTDFQGTQTADGDVVFWAQQKEVPSNTFVGEGIYSTAGGLHKVADTDTPVPGGVGTFSSLNPFTPQLAIDNGVVVFIGIDANGTRGIYIEKNGLLNKMIADGDPLAGGTVAPSTLSVGRNGLKGNVFLFTAWLDSGTKGIYRADFVPPTAVLLRRTTDRKWFSYTLDFDNTVVTTGDKGFLGLTRNQAFQTVSRSDFDGDGQPDLLLRDMTGAENGRWVLATLSGKIVTSEGFADLTRNADWQVVSTNDFDGDGKADVLVRNTVDGRWLMYLMDSQTVKSQSVLAMSNDVTDTVAGTGDFNGDGRSDVLLRRADGSWLLYLLDGLTAPVQSMPAMTAELDFAVQALADFDADGNTDVLLRRTDGRWFLYLLDGEAILDSGSPAMTENTDFSLISHADFNGDGSADALLRRTDGRWFLYSLNGLTFISQGSLDMTRNPAFQIVTTDDFNGDGKADALLRRTDGRWILYGIDGDVPVLLGQSPPDMTRNTAWVPQIVP